MCGDGDAAWKAPLGRAPASAAPCIEGQNPPADQVAPTVQHGAPFRAGEWAAQAYLKAANAGLDDLFGYSVAFENDTLVVGARFEAGGHRQQRSGYDTITVYEAGAVYVFVRDGDTWQAYLKAPNAEEDDYRGLGGARATRCCRRLQAAAGIVNNASGYDTTNSCAMRARSTSSCATATPGARRPT